MGRVIWFSQILYLCFMMLHFQVQCSSPSQSSPDSPPHLYRPEECSALLDFKSATKLKEDCVGAHDRLQTWNKSVDCCLWEGITCDKMKGHVIGLDLTWNCIGANLTANSSLFHLEKLQNLSLANNYFHYPSISFGFHRWKSLTYLDISDSGYMNDSLLFEISSLQKLVSFSLSYNQGLILNNMKFQMLVHNLTKLRFLILDFMDMSSISPSSLLNLTSSLEHLSLSRCFLQGNFPSQVFNYPSLQLLDLSYNYYLRGNLPLSNWSSTLKYLSLRNTSFLGELPHSIGNPKLLEELDLYGNQFYGSVPGSLANLTDISFLDFSGNHLQGQIPDVFGKMHKLTHLSFTENNFCGEIPTSIFNLTHLTFFSLSSNKLIGALPHNISELSSLRDFYVNSNLITGRVPSWLFYLPSLCSLDLSNNKLIGPIAYVEKPNLILEEVYLSDNEISGSIPSSFFDLVNLTRLDLSSNNLSGTITPNMLSKLVQLESLDLSNNNLLSLSNNATSVDYSFLNLQSLRLSSCNIHKFPSFLRKAMSLELLDISKNKISGQIYKWEIEGMALGTLDLSYNFLTGIDLFAFGNLDIVDLRSNLLQGSLPILRAQNIISFSISGNNLIGEIPLSYCNLTSLRVLDLANNSLGGKIPECLENSKYLSILDLQFNKFHGRIPNLFVKNNYYLVTLNLNSNQLEGRLPSSLVNCSGLEILDVGNNYLNDTFPHWLGVLPSLQVLILRSNRFHGAISDSMPIFYFPCLTIIDVSHNDFMGLLPSSYFKNLKGMRDVHGDKAKLLYVGGSFSYYEVYVKLVMKGSEMDVRILEILTIIDFSSNQFHGPIPEELGELNSLLLLNLSHNNLTGQIPSSLGKIIELESLDLSSNKLDGRIPEQLTNLTFLSVLNLSHNKLVGHIPEGKQFNTFSNDSYIGNSRLCGLPLTEKCHKKEEPGAPLSKFDKEDDSVALFEWKFALAGYGCGLVLGLSMGHIAFTTGKPWWVVKKVEKCQQKFVGRCNGRHKKRKTQKPNQCS